MDDKQRREARERCERLTKGRGIHEGVMDMVNLTIAALDEIDRLEGELAALRRTLTDDWPVFALVDATKPENAILCGRLAVQCQSSMVAHEKNRQTIIDLQAELDEARKQEAPKA